MPQVCSVISSSFLLLSDVLPSTDISRIYDACGVSTTSSQLQCEFAYVKFRRSSKQSKTVVVAAVRLYVCSKIFQSERAQY